MLVISRKPGESFRIGDDLTITILEVSGDKIKIGIDAPREIPVLRTEVAETERFNCEAALSGGACGLGPLAAALSLAGQNRKIP